jgi:hypothetical protein
MPSCPERHSEYEPSDYTTAAVDARVSLSDSEAVSRWFIDLITVEDNSALTHYFDPDPQPGKGWSGGWFERLDPDADPNTFLESDLLSVDPARRYVRARPYPHGRRVRSTTHAVEGSGSVHGVHGNDRGGRLAGGLARRGRGAGALLPVAIPSTKDRV